MNVARSRQKNVHLAVNQHLETESLEGKETDQAQALLQSRRLEFTAICPWVVGLIEGDSVGVIE